jgi:hypothetical protein
MENFQNNLQDNIGMIKFPSFTQLSTTLHDYQNTISSWEVKPTSNYLEKTKIMPQTNYQPSKKPYKGIIQLNPPQPNQHVETHVASIKTKNP